MPARAAAGRPTLRMNAVEDRDVVTSAASSRRRFAARQIKGGFPT
jgi:hypothetical protein